MSEEQKASPGGGASSPDSGSASNSSLLNSNSGPHSQSNSGSHSQSGASSHSQSGSGAHSSSGAASSTPAGSGRKKKSSKPDAFIGMRLKDTYEIVEKIGEGGMGNVYVAIQYPLERKVAIKLLKPNQTNAEGEHYFMREVRAINSLRHPNIINILDFGKEPSGLLFLVMEHLPGGTLKDIIYKEYPVEPLRICRIAIQILSALEEAHNNGIVHCDLKPANIMVERVAGQSDFVKVLDFGIAKVKDSGLEVGPYTQAGNIVGTFDYMSPEQIMRQELDGRTDVWALGVILYEMLTRKRIFHDADAVSIIGRVMQMPIRPPSEVAKKKFPIPASLEAVVLKAMDRDLEERFQSAQQMRDALEQVIYEIESGEGMRPRVGGDGQGAGPASAGSALVDSGLVKGAPNVAGSAQGANVSPSTDNSFTGLSGVFSQPLGAMTSQHLAAGLAAGTAALDQMFKVEELEGSLLGDQKQLPVLAIQQWRRQDADLGSEELERRVTKETTIIERTIAQYGGTVNSHQGGTYLVLFDIGESSPSASGLRAIQCAVALQKQFQALEHGMEHLGLGLVFGEVLIPAKEGGSAYGESVDRAMGLARGARRARVVVDEGLQALTRQFVQYQPLRVDSAGEVGEVVRIDPSAEDFADPGRAHDFDNEYSALYIPRPLIFNELCRYATLVKNKEGQAVSVVGGIGSGKSTLVKHFEEEHAASGWATFFVRGSDLKDQKRLAPVRAWIRQIASTYPEPKLLIEKACEAIGLKAHIGQVVNFYLKDSYVFQVGTEPPWSDEESYAHFSASVLRRLLGFAMKSGPVLLVLDDVNCDDAVLMSFLHNLVTSIRKQPVYVLVTQGTASTSEAKAKLSDLFHRVRMEGFTDEESAQFIGQTLGYLPPPAVLNGLHKQSSGNPLVLFEFARALKAQGNVRLEQMEQLSQLGLSLNLNELLVRRVDELDPTLRDLLAIASVLGESFREDFFFQVVPSHLDPRANLERLVAADFLEARFDTFQRVHLAFHPGVLRRLIYERLPRARRDQIHALISAFIEENAHFVAIDPFDLPVVLAFHYRSREQNEEAARYLEKAADALMAFYDYTGATTHLMDALNLLREQKVPPLHASWLSANSKLITVLRERGKHEEAYQIFEDLPALGLIPEHQKLMLTYERGLLAMEVGRLEESEKLLTTLQMEADQSGNAKLIVRTLIALAQLADKRNQLPRSINLLMEVSKKLDHIDGLSLEDAEDRKLLWSPYNQLGALFIRQKKYEHAQQYLNTALQQARGIQDYRGMIRILSNLGALCLHVRNINQAQEYFLKALQVARGAGDLLNQSRILTNLGIAAMEANDLEGCKEYFKQARVIAEDISWYDGLAQLSLQIKRLKKALG